MATEVPYDAIVIDVGLPDGDGIDLCAVLRDAGVWAPILILTAHAEIRDQPKTADDADAHEQRRAFGSLAQEIMDAGVAGVVAMRYNVYVVTAAQFVADLYASLVRGRSLGNAGSATGLLPCACTTSHSSMIDSSNTPWVEG